MAPETAIDPATSRPAAVLVLQGEKALCRGEERLAIPGGEMFLLPAQAEISVENFPDPVAGRYLALCLDFAPDMLARAGAGAPLPDGPAPTALAAWRVEGDAALAASVGHLLDMALACPDNDRLLSLCREAILVLLSERSPCFPLFWRGSASWRARCADLIASDPGRAWTAEEVARRLAVSERSLRRHLEAEETSLRRVLQDVRLNAGLGLLQTGKLGVGEAAGRCGYDSASRFAALFRERFGVSPSDVLRYNAVSG